MKCTLMLFSTFLLFSCWKFNGNPYPSSQQKVWGNKPVYAAESEAKQIIYDPQKHPIKRPGNIYAFGNFIFQMDIGRGIHVIDNSLPANADRIGFITVKGCEQISIKEAYLYSNSYADLVTLDISDPSKIKILSRVPDAFPEFRYNYPLVEPEETGYYTCPRTDSVVVGWVKDSVYTDCYKY
jgi:hypothetical protein